MTTLLVAANRKEMHRMCREVIIGMKAAGEKMYIEKEDVLAAMTRASGGSLVNRPLQRISLAQLERTLESNAWIRNAELYFDSRDVLHVFIEEREPIARIFTTRGSSFYLDSSGHKMPLLDKMSARVPVFTGYPLAGKMNASDSMLLDGMKRLAVFIYGNEFWNAQIGQVDITADRKFELIPVVGDHIIRLGTADKLEDKLNRLQVFYRQVLSKVGFSKYAALSVEFDGQVVAVNKGPVSAVDSLQLQKNIEELMNRANLQQVDDDMLPQQIRPIMPKPADSIAAMNTVAAPADGTEGAGNAGKRQAQAGSEGGKEMEKRKPKAVMGKKGALNSN